jgi:hypothetical protein
VSVFRRNCLLILAVAFTMLAGGVGTASATEDSLAAPAEQVAAEVWPSSAPPQAVAPTSRQAKSAAASPCWYSGGNWWCNNRVPTLIYASSGEVIDRLWTNPSWFICRSDNGGHVGGPHPNRWEWTQGDDHGLWGWVKDIDIASETNPLPVCSV